MDLTGKEIVIRALSVNNFAGTSVVDIDLLTEAADGIYSSAPYRLTHSQAFDNMEDSALLTFVTAKLEAL